MPRYLVFIGQCQTMPGYPDRYMAISIAGQFSLEEANNYILEVLDGPCPPYQDYFQHPLHLRIIFFYALPEFRVLRKLKYYLEYFTTIDFTSQYDWQIARHEIHGKICEFVPLDQEHRPLVTGYLIDGPHQRNLN